MTVLCIGMMKITSATMGLCLICLHWGRVKFVLVVWRAHSKPTEVKGKNPIDFNGLCIRTAILILNIRTFYLILFVMLMFLKGNMNTNHQSQPSALKLFCCWTRWTDRPIYHQNKGHNLWHFISWTERLTVTNCMNLTFLLYKTSLLIL